MKVVYSILNNITNFSGIVKKCGVCIRDGLLSKSVDWDVTNVKTRGVTSAKNLRRVLEQ